MMEIVDWSKIEIQAPKSLKLYIDWDNLKDNNFLEHNQRDLFDFFDKNDLIIQITFNKDRFGYIM